MDGAAAIDTSTHSLDDEGPTKRKQLWDGYTLEQPWTDAVRLWELWAIDYLAGSAGQLAKEKEKTKRAAG